MVADVSIRLGEENEENRGRKVLFLNLGFSRCVCLFTKKMKKRENWIIVYYNGVVSFCLGKLVYRSVGISLLMFLFSL